ncbi:hypothetical protein MRX96_059320 [Rhipicephalus microplus]
MRHFAAVLRNRFPGNGAWRKSWPSAVVTRPRETFPFAHARLNGARVLRVRSAGATERRHCFDTMDATLVRHSEEATPARTEGATKSEAVHGGEALMRTDRSTGSRCARCTLLTPSSRSFECKLAFVALLS